MRFALECTVDAKIKIGKEIRVVKHPYEYVLTPDKHGWLSSIMISAKVTNPHRFSARIEPGEEPSKAKITIEGDRGLYERIINEFQELESIISFKSLGSLRSIDWYSPKEYLIPETREEVASVDIGSFQIAWKYPEQPVNLTEQAFHELVHAKDSYSSLRVVKAFFREGINEFDKLRYINAFYNFFFVLEDLYGGGKSGMGAIITAFKRSPEFRESVQWVLSNHVDEHERHRTAIQNLCSQQNLPYTTDGLIELLRKVRNNLHHYSAGDTKDFWTPFKQKDFESITFFTLGLAMHGIALREVGISKSLGQQP